jgi:hypothetical protein
MKGGHTLPAVQHDATEQDAPAMNWDDRVNY